MRFIDLTERNAFQNFEGRGRGHRKAAMGTIDPAVAVVQRGDENFFHCQLLEPDARADDVRNRIERTHLVKVNVFGGDPMNFAFGLGDARKDTPRMFFDERGELALVDQRADLAMAASLVVMVVVMMMRMLLMRV